VCTSVRERTTRILELENVLPVLGNTFLPQRNRGELPQGFSGQEMVKLSLLSRLLFASFLFLVAGFCFAQLNLCMIHWEESTK